MSDAAVPEKGPNTALQAVTAFLVVGGALAAVWATQLLPDETSVSGPAVCEQSRDAAPARKVSPDRLCEALNRPDLPALLGTPSEQVDSARGSVSEFKSALDGTRTVDPEAEVRLKTYSVNISASYDGLPRVETVRFLDRGAEFRSFLGHPAVLYSDRTMAFSFENGKAGAGQGGIARHLLVSTGPRDKGVAFHIAIWRQDDVVPDDDALFRVAERVLPAIPGWSTA
jgi:hypothetical protein